jgi:uncharacterized DUF497 family protein
MKLLLALDGFEWDSSNAEKNWLKHRVEYRECEEAFLDPESIQYYDTLHSGKEDRYIVIGRTAQQRILFVVFTLRQNKVRVISVRDAHKKERKRYEEKT